MDVKYTLVDCEKDIVPLDIFLEAVPEEIEANNVINIDELGRHFVAFYEPGVDKTYNFTLLSEEQIFEEACGTMDYAMEIVEPSLFGEAFAKDQFNITLDPLYSNSGPYFTTSLKWILHNDVISYDLGETIFEQTTCIGFLKA